MSTRANSTCWPKAAGGRRTRTPCGASLRKLRAMRKSLPKPDQLLLRIGAAKKEAGRAFGFVKILMPPAGQAVTRETFSFQVDKAKLKATEQRDGHYLPNCESRVNTIEEHVKLRRFLRGLGFPFDVFIIATEKFEESKNVFGGIAYPAHKYGRVIYEAA